MDYNFPEACSGQQRFRAKRSPSSKHMHRHFLRSGLSFRRKDRRCLTSVEKVDKVKAARDGPPYPLIKEYTEYTWVHIQDPCVI